MALSKVTPPRSRARGRPASENPAHPAEPPADARTIDDLREAARGCHVCPFALKATQTVFGEGAVHARLMLVGEQPGDQEDLAGEPFVGPAGRLLDRVLNELGIPRSELYVTNAVKHFKFEPRGKFRLHQKPNAAEVKACHPWLEEEIKRVHPEVIVALGATAAQSVCGRVVKITRERGQWVNENVMITWHPSALLRADPGVREQMTQELAEDLRRAWARITRA